MTSTKIHLSNHKTPKKALCSEKTALFTMFALSVSITHLMTWHLPKIAHLRLSPHTFTCTYLMPQCKCMLTFLFLKADFFLLSDLCNQGKRPVESPPKLQTCSDLFLFRICALTATVLLLLCVGVISVCYIAPLLSLTIINTAFFKIGNLSQSST